MTLKIEKLDGRYNGSLFWKTRVYFQDRYTSQHDRFRQFHQLRVWMTELYGPSCERDYYSATALGFKDHGSFDPPWCWHIDRQFPNNNYIYIKDDEMLSHVLLKWN
jgi:hypothetical protein